MPGWCRNSGPVTCLQDGHQGNSSCQGCRNCNPLESMSQINLQINKHGKDYHWNETQYEPEGEDDLGNLSYHLTWE